MFRFKKKRAGPNQFLMIGGIGAVSSNEKDKKKKPLFADSA
jgi:hypothetical protein